MKYDFTSIIDRHGKDAKAVEGIGPAKEWGNEPDLPDEGFSFIPMWVADMNFATAPAVTDAIIRRAQHPLFGYFDTRPEYYDSIIRWQTERNGHSGLQKEHIHYMNGVHGAISCALDALTVPGDSVLIHAPEYIGFMSDVEFKGRVAVHSELKQDEAGIWRMDYEDMDRKIRANNIHTVIFCSPHNPCGRVWEREELEQAMDVFERNECTIISDEIWADVVYSGHQHIPTQMVNDYARENTIAVYATSKTFNLAGLIGSYSIVYDKKLRDILLAQAGRTNLNEQNVLSMHALIGAYSPEGEEWANELLQVLETNCRTFADYINQEVNGVSCQMPQGTYMIFLDCTEYCARTGKTLDEIIHAGWKVGIGWQDGRMFLGPCHIRVNLASPTATIEEAVARLKEYVFTE